MTPIHRADSRRYLCGLQAARAAERVDLYRRHATCKNHVRKRSRMQHRVDTHSSPTLTCSNEHVTGAYARCLRFAVSEWTEYNRRHVDEASRIGSQPHAPSGSNNFDWLITPDPAIKAAQLRAHGRVRRGGSAMERGSIVNRDIPFDGGVSMPRRDGRAPRFADDRLRP